MKRINSLSRVGKFVVGVGAIIFACILCSIIGMLLPDSEEAVISEENLVQTSMAEILQTAVASPTQEEEAEQSLGEEVFPTETEPTRVASIPGSNPADIILSLEDRGFTCGSVEVWEGNEDFPGDLYYRECRSSSSGYDLIVEILGYELLEVDSVQATALDYTEPFGDLAIDFLGFMATIPYDGAEQEAARAWVEETLPTIVENGDVRIMSFGGVAYSLYGIPTARTLEIGAIEE